MLKTNNIKWCYRKLFCACSSLALEIIGGSLSKQPFVVWQIVEWLKSESILKSHKDLLSRLRNSFRYMEDESSIKEAECFMDLGLFSEDQRICGPTWIDICGELYDLDENGKKGMNIIHKLTVENSVNYMIHQIFILSLRGIHKWGKKKYWLYFAKVRIFLASLMHLKKVLN